MEYFDVVMLLREKSMLKGNPSQELEVVIFISIHVNASNNSDVEGFSVCCKKGDQKSKSLAKEISISNTLFTNRGLDERSDLYVLNKFAGTAVLIEAGFISNTNDLSNMSNHTEKIAHEIADGINNYIK